MLRDGNYAGQGTSGQGNTRDKEDSNQSCKKAVSWYLGYRTFFVENPDIFQKSTKKGTISSLNMLQNSSVIPPNEKLLGKHA